MTIDSLPAMVDFIVKWIKAMSSKPKYENDNKHSNLKNLYFEIEQTKKFADVAILTYRYCLL